MINLINIILPFYSMLLKMIILIILLLLIIVDHHSRRANTSTFQSIGLA